MKFAHININYIKELADGDTDVLHELVGTFITSISSSLDSLVVAINSNDNAGGAFFAHKLRGSLNFIGSAQGTDQLTLIEEYCTNNIQAGQIQMMTTVQEITSLILKELDYLHNST